MLIVLLVLATGLLINRQSHVHSLQTTLAEQQKIIDKQKAADDTKKNFLDSHKALYGGKLRLPTNMEESDSRYYQAWNEWDVEKRKMQEQYDYIFSEYKNLRTFNDKLMNDWQRALPQLKQYHQEHPEQPLPFDP